MRRPTLTAGHDVRRRRPAVRRRLVPLFLLASTAALGSMLFLGTSSPHATGVAPRCSSVTVPVGPADGAPKTLVLAGTLCLPMFGGTPGTVQLLVHGATYNRAYWDFPVDRPLNSYVTAATLDGYATFAIDRVGDGASSRPPSGDVNFSTTIAELHQVVQALRSGGVGGTRFARVEWVGHSFGSIYAIGEISTYHDVDAVILTGFAHKLSPSFVQLSLAHVAPANVEARFASLDPGYLAIAPGYVGIFYYYTPTADPAVIARDAATTDTVTGAELGTGLPTVTTSLSLGIGVPVLEVVGDHDRIYCAPDASDCSSAAGLKKQEAPFFSPSACLHTAVIPQTGHDLNLHLTAPVTDFVQLSWSDSVLGSHGGRAHCPST